MFLLPVLLMLVLIGLTTAMQGRIADNNDAIRDALNDGSAQRALEIQEAVWGFHYAMESYVLDNETPEQFSAFASRFDSLRSAVNAATIYFSTEAEELEEHEASLNILSELEKSVASLSVVLPSTSPLPETTLKEIERRFGPIAATSNEFSNLVNKEHRATIEELLDTLRQQESQRFALYLAILFCGILLIEFLRRSSRQFQSSAKLAHAAEEANTFFAAALQAATLGVLIRNVQNSAQNAVFINQALTDMTGYTFSDIVNSPPGVLFGLQNDLEALAAMRAALRKNEATVFHLQTCRKDGTTFWGEWRLCPVTDKNGRMTHYVCLLADITGLRQTQEDLLHAKEVAEKASQVKSNFLATMSHEIRTPINGLLGILNLLNETPLNAQQSTYLCIALTSGRALSEIINDILDYSKIEAGKLTIVTRPFSLRDLLQDVVNLTQPATLEKNLDLAFDIPITVSDYVASDAGRIRQMLLNLVSNAIKFTEKGSVTIHVRQTTPPNEEGVITLRFEIVDTGCGISPENQASLFKDFSQVESTLNRSHGGTGLGLAITKRLATMLGGEVGLESSIGGGSTFWFAIPATIAAVPNDEAAAIQPASTDAVSPADKAILLVEDNVTNQIVANSYLEKLGYHADLAATGQEAIAKTKARIYDLILMDISMPEMDGMEATRRIRALNGWAAAVPIVALTAHVLPEDRERCLAAGMNDFLSKPIDRAMLAAVMQRWLTRAAPTSAATATMSKTESAPITIKPVLDKEALRRLAEDLDVDTMFRITQAFLDDVAKRLDGMRVSCEVNAFITVQNEAHALKGSSANCALPQFSALMAEIEAAAKKRNCDDLAPLLQQTDDVYIAARDSLVAERELYRR